MDIVGSRQRASKRFKKILAGVDRKMQEARQRSPFVLTPEAFFELFLVCCSWQYNYWPDAKSNWTTVDKIVRILYLRNIITKKQRGRVFTDKRVQTIFKMHAHKVLYGTGLLSGDLVANSPHPIVIPCQIGVEWNDERMLRDYRIYLTPRGKEKGTQLASKYQRVITREQYETELKKDEEFKRHRSGRHMGAVMDNYRAKVLDETDDKAE